MPLYELILRKPDGADEGRFTDHEPDAERPLVMQWSARPERAPGRTIALIGVLFAVAYTLGLILLAKLTPGRGA